MQMIYIKSVILVSYLSDFYYIYRYLDVQIRTAYLVPGQIDATSIVAIALKLSSVVGVLIITYNSKCML